MATSSGGGGGGGYAFPAECIHPETGLVHNFAFGSNLSAEKMAARGISVLRARPAVLRGYTLRFSQLGFPPTEPSFANLETAAEGASSEVHGVLFDLTPQQFGVLWHGEGAGGWYATEMVGLNCYPEAGGQPFPPSRPPRSGAAPSVSSSAAAASGYGSLLSGGQVPEGSGTRPCEGERIEGAVIFVSLMERRVPGGGELPPSHRYKALLTSGAAAAGLDPAYRRDVLEAAPCVPPPGPVVAFLLAQRLHGHNVMAQVMGAYHTAGPTDGADGGGDDDGPTTVPTAVGAAAAATTRGAGAVGQGGGARGGGTRGGGRCAPRAPPRALAVFDGARQGYQLWSSRVGASLLGTPLVPLAYAVLLPEVALGLAISAAQAAHGAARGAAQSRPALLLRSLRSNRPQEGGAAADSPELQSER